MLNTNGWFDIKYVKPEDGQSVLGYFDVFGTIEVYQYNKSDQGDTFANETGFLTNDITYWLPLPTPPKPPYDPLFGDDRVCKCGHSYYRHFDTYENMSPVGCKYCGCNEFEERTEDDLLTVDEYIAQLEIHLDEMYKWYTNKSKNYAKMYPVKRSIEDWEEMLMMKSYENE